MSAPGVRGQTFDKKGELPPGWKTKVDPAKKRRFYYNRDKNVTSWHRPKPEEAAPAIEKWEPDVEQPPAPAPAPAPDPKKTTAAKGAKLRVKLHGDLAEKHGEWMKRHPRLAEKHGEGILEIEVSEHSKRAHTRHSGA